MKNAIKKMTMYAAVAAVFALAACGGGGGNYSTGGHYYTHEELAREFVRRVNSDIAGFDLELVKINTLQYDYIVVWDRDYNSYDAYYIGAYAPGADLANYINRYDSSFYYDLVYEGNGYYRDPITGTRFQKQAISGKNLAKMKALKEQITVARTAEKLREAYGLSAEKSLDTARFAFKLQNSPAGTYNVKDYDAFAKELTGSTISEFQADFKDGKMASLANRIQTAADVTGMGMEGVNSLINDMFMSQK